MRGNPRHFGVTPFPPDDEWLDAWPGDTLVTSAGRTFVFTGLGTWERVK